MAFDWRGYLAVAEWLTKNADSEAALFPPEAAHRAAISRAYYCAFQAAMALLVKRNEFTPTGLGADHGSVMYAYQTNHAEPRRRIGTNLDRLKDRRRRADYDSAHIERSAEVAQACLRAAREVLTYLASQ